MAVDVSFLVYFGPILAYFLVGLVVATVIVNSNLLGKSKWVGIFAGLVIATIFVAAGGVVDYVLVVTPWIAALLLSVFFILLLSGFAGVKPDSKFFKSMGPVFIVVAGIIFIVSAFVVYSDIISRYVIFSDYYIGNGFTDLLYSPRVLGAILLLFVAAIVSWVVAKK